VQVNGHAWEVEYVAIVGDEHSNIGRFDLNGQQWSIIILVDHDWLNNPAKKTTRFTSTARWGYELTPLPGVRRGVRTRDELEWRQVGDDPHRFGDCRDGAASK
jgi:hypothetical protein